jgi:hypothetical protein
VSNEAQVSFEWSATIFLKLNIIFMQHWLVLF